jgi:anti-sigma regulatory factor (Ser/Thr protein kinase)
MAADQVPPVGEVVRVAANPNRIIGDVLLVMNFALDDLAQARAACRAALLDVRLDHDRVSMLVGAINEGLINAIQHGGGAGMLALLYDGETLFAQIVDHGPGLVGPIPDQLPPQDAPGGRGLLMARQMVDQLAITSDSGGTTLRLHMAHRG